MMVNRQPNRKPIKIASQRPVYKKMVVGRMPMYDYIVDINHFYGWFGAMAILALIAFGFFTGFDTVIRNSILPVCFYFFGVVVLIVASVITAGDVKDVRIK